MSDCEIAQLFGVGLATVRREIKTVLRSGVVSPDCSSSAVLVGNSLLPEYYDLDMVVALAFRIHTRQAVILRQWILERCRSPQIMLALVMRQSIGIN